MNTVEAPAGQDEQDKRPRRRFLPHVPAPLRHGITIFVLLIILEYVVIPELERAHLDQIERIGIGWLIGGVVLEAASLFCYFLLTKALLPERSRTSLFTLARVDLAGSAVSHVVPGGTAASAALGYRLLTNAGVDPTDVGFVMASKGIGSAVVLNVLLWAALVISIPLAGFHRIYVVVALVGMIALLLIAGLVYAFTRGEEFAVRVVRSVGDHIPRVGADPLERLVRQLSGSLRSFSRDRQVMRMALLWATLNWVLDAASLWFFVAALGHYVDPVELFSAYGIVNVLAVLPFTPSGLGLVEAILPLLLASSGVTKSVATLAVIGWRLVNFWLPIPVGAAAYLSLRVPRGKRIREGRQVLHELVAPEAVPPGVALPLDADPARADAGTAGGPPLGAPPSDPAEPEGPGEVLPVEDPLVGSAAGSPARPTEPTPPSRSNGTGQARDQPEEAPQAFRRH